MRRLFGILNKHQQVHEESVICEKCIRKHGVSALEVVEYDGVQVAAENMKDISENDYFGCNVCGFMNENEPSWHFRMWGFVLIGKNKEPQQITENGPIPADRPQDVHLFDKFEEAEKYASDMNAKTNSSDYSIVPGRCDMTYGNDVFIPAPPLPERVD